MSDNSVRAVRLENGMVINFYGMLLEWEDNLFHGVVEKPSNIHSEGNTHKYVRTGLKFSTDEMTMLSKEMKWWIKRL